MRQRIRLTESDLHRIVRESVKRVLREGGHLYGHDDNGTPFTNSKETYRGVPGSTYIWHGAWSDPGIWWKGVELNANDVEDSLYGAYKDECGEYCEDLPFEQWVEDQGTDWIAATLDELVWAAQGNP